jgi:hypothetical protein
MRKVRVEGKTFFITEGESAYCGDYTIFCNKIWRVESYRPNVHAMLTRPKQNIYTIVDLSEVILPKLFYVFNCDLIDSDNFHVSKAERIDAESLLNKESREDWMEIFSENEIGMKEAIALMNEEV